MWKGLVQLAELLREGYKDDHGVRDTVKPCYECGTCTSCPVAELVPEYYNPRTLLALALINLEEVLMGRGVWLCAWCYRCYERCPQGIKLPEIFLLVRNLALERGYLQGFRESMKIICEKVPLPKICIRACFHPERSTLDGPLVPKIRRKKVAIIGSGPSGLSAAHGLVKGGYQVMIYESLPKLGGMLRVGLPHFRLPEDLLDAEIERLKSMGWGL